MEGKRRWIENKNIYISALPSSTLNEKEGHPPPLENEKRKENDGKMRGGEVVTGIGKKKQRGENTVLPFYSKKWSAPSPFIK